MTFLDEVQKRLAEVQKRAQEVTVRLSRVQQEHQSVMQELGSYQKIVQVEMLRLQRERQVTGTPALPTTGQAQQHSVIVEPPPMDEGNKTDAIRTLLREHPAGMTPAQLWQQMRSRVTHRQYIYSVLKRLKDQKQVVERRGKYYFQALPKSEGEEHIVVQ